MHMNPVLWPHHRGEEGLGIASGSGGGSGAPSGSMLPHAGYHQPTAEQGGSPTGAATAASAIISPSHGGFPCESMAAMSPSSTAQAAASTTTAAAAAAYSRSQFIGK